MMAAGMLMAGKQHNTLIYSTVRKVVGPIANSKAL